MKTTCSAAAEEGASSRPLRKLHYFKVFYSKDLVEMKKHSSYVVKQSYSSAIFAQSKIHKAYLKAVTNDFRLSLSAA